jgi:CheY-like chemotaxis protein
VTPDSVEQAAHRQAALLRLSAEIAGAPTEEAISRAVVEGRRDRVLRASVPVMDGWQFAAELRTQDAWRDLPVVVITAKDLTAEDRRVLNGNVQGVLPKGAFSPDELLHGIHHLLPSTSHRPGHSR